MYVDNWHKTSTNKIVGGGKEYTRKFNGQPVRVTFGARLGSYVKNADPEKWLALEFKEPGTYSVSIRGTSGHVRLHSVEKMDESTESMETYFTDISLFSKKKLLEQFMTSTVMPNPKYVYAVYDDEE